MLTPLQIKETVVLSWTYILASFDVRICHFAKTSSSKGRIRLSAMASYHHCIDGPRALVLHWDPAPLGPALRTKMLPQSHFVAFNDIKYKNLSNALRDSTAFTLSAAYVNHSLKNWARSTSYVCASFVDLLRESVS